ncbi:MAG: hypothetical protein CNCCGFBP_00513 [Fimbriimonadaceae bacterium]|nr:hypothetical protein [Fimbriimonadaceae bacterium]
MPFVRDGLKARIHLGRSSGQGEGTQAYSCGYVLSCSPGRGSPNPPGQTARSAACPGHPGTDSAPGLTPAKTQLTEWATEPDNVL